MMSAAEILAKLKAHGITQKAIADVLGIQQPNANALYKPVKRTGKPRDLAYDEGVVLIERFKLDQPGPDEPARSLPSASVLTSTFAVLLESLGIAPYEDERAQKLASQFPRVLQSIEALHSQVGDGQGLPPEAGAPARGEAIVTQ